jgi:Flp pilus assembly protein TadD
MTHATIDPTTLLARGEELLELADTAGARTCFARVLAADAANVRARHGLGLCFEAERRDEEALAAYEAALADAPDDPGVAFSAASTCHRLGLLDDAEERYRRVLAQVPDHVMALTNLGALALVRGDHAGAQAALERAVACDPTSEAAWQNLATVLERAGDAAGLGRCLEEVVARAPESVPLRYRLALYLLGRGDREPARRVFESVLALDPSCFEAQYRVGQIALAGGDARAAASRLAVACQLRPDSPAAANDLGVAHWLLGDRDGARVCFTHALSVAADYEPARHNLDALDDGAGAPGDVS